MAFMRSWQRAWLALAVVALLVSMATCASETSQTKVDWLYDWNEASTRAENEDKLVMINFYTDACPWCRRLDSDTFSDEEVGAFLNENVVPLKSNAGKTDLHRSYDIPGVPTTVFTSPDGTKVGQIIGYKAPDEFRQLTETILDQWVP